MQPFQKRTLQGTWNIFGKLFDNLQLLKRQENSEKISKKLDFTILLKARF